MPCWPTQAVHGPATSSQHAPDFRQSRSSACVADRRGGTTVTSCVAEPIDVSPSGSADGQAELCARPTVAETAAQSNAHDQSAIVLGIAGQGTRERRRLGSIPQAAAASSASFAPSIIAPATISNAPAHAVSYSGFQASPASAAIEAISVAPTTG